MEKKKAWCKLKCPVFGVYDIGFKVILICNMGHDCTDGDTQR